jgi:asparagine synthetase B (glutamine-hydrolysing)
MCGILLVKSSTSIPLERHLSAFDILNSRGPDFSRHFYNGKIFCGQTVLRITGTDEYYNYPGVRNSFLAYNGEIYNYREFGSFSSDIEFVDYAVNTDLDLLKQGWGPWAWAWTNGEQVRYAADPQGEKTLYQYQDSDILIVCSEPAPILQYIQPKKIIQDYSQRHWCVISQTPWQGVQRIDPGVVYVDGFQDHSIDSIFNWIQPVNYQTIDEAVEDFEPVWRQTIKIMTPDCPTALTYSGGLDSSIILQYLDPAELYTTNMLGKDPIVNNICDFLLPDEQTRLHLITVDEQQWAHAYNSVLHRTQMPVQSWSFVGQWIISEHCQQRVLFTGAGADELFGGYNAYQQLNYQDEESTSAYSLGGDSVLWQQCMAAYNDPRQATLLMDYFYQIAGCDARGVDVITGAWGIEARNPFMAAPVVKFALSLPFQFKVGQFPKPVIRKLFTNRWGTNMIYTKKGFTGHCNDSLPWINVDIKPTGSRDLDWKNIVKASFYSCPKIPEYQTTQEKTL